MTTELTRLWARYDDAIRKEQWGRNIIIPIRQGLLSRIVAQAMLHADVDSRLMVGLGFELHEFCSRPGYK